jgi:hypothetical protein
MRGDNVAGVAELPTIEGTMMSRYRLAIASVALIAGMITPSSPARATGPNDLLIIAHKSAPASSISRAELISYFMKKRTSWKGGGRVLPINKTRGTALRQAFLSRVLNMTQGEEDAYWSRLKISGSSKTQPPELSNTLKAVFYLRRSVSYIFRKDYRAGMVKILAVF